MILSEEQIKIGNFLRKKRSESLVVQALAGSGKTTTLIKVVLPTLLDIGISPYDILVLMFSKPVNVEFERRLNQENLNIRSATFHSASYNLLRQAFGTETDFGKLYRIGKSLGVNSDDIFKLVGLCKTHGVGAIDGFGINDQNVRKISERHLIDVDDQEIVQCKHLLEESLKEKELCDFDDMIWLAVANKLSIDYKYVIVDEFQDNSDLRNEFIKKCCGDCKLVAVGDRKQAIFSFAGSNPKSMDDLKNHFKAEELSLTITYRCAKSITNFAKKWAPNIRYRDGAPEGKVVKMSFSDFYKQKVPKDSAILCRINAPLIPLAFHLANSGQKCYIRGRSIGEEMANLAKRWKWDHVDQLQPKLVKFLDREKIKLLPDKENLYRSYVDKVNCLVSIIDHCKGKRKTDREFFLKFVRGLFSDNGEGIVLGSIHFSKGMEWKRVYIWGWEKLMPAKWAKQDWEKEAESCLQFVAITRAIDELYLVS